MREPFSCLDALDSHCLGDQADPFRSGCTLSKLALGAPLACYLDCLDNRDHGGLEDLVRKNHTSRKRTLASIQLDAEVLEYLLERGGHGHDA